tara:strand:+ start:988 stop:1365 length:378 start_codon:yes stop_codon:yes gene_type:complete
MNNQNQTIFIRCHKCLNDSTVYHLDWSTIICQTCRAEIQNPAEQPDRSKIKIFLGKNNVTFFVSDTKIAQTCDCAWLELEDDEFENINTTLFGDTIPSCHHIKIECPVKRYATINDQPIQTLILN